MRTIRDGQFLETGYVLAWHDQQPVELGSTDHHDALVDVLGNVASHTPRALAGRPLRNGARAAFQGQGSALAGDPRRLVGLIHVLMPPIIQKQRLSLW